MAKRHSWGHWRPSSPEARPRGERGSSLVIALAAMIVMGAVLAGLVTYATVNHRSTRAYATQRDERYAGDAAISAAVNWVANNALLGRDPNLDANDPSCVYQVPTSVGTVTASCAATAGGGSGQPAQGGLLPPESLLMLGQRDGEPGQYNAPDCAGWWDTVAGWFSSGAQTGVNEGRGIRPEDGAWFRGRQGLGFASATCSTERSRTRSDFNIQGDLAAASTIRVDDGGRINVVGGDAISRSGASTCTGGSLTCREPQTRSGYTDELTYLNGTSEVSDPGRGSSAATPGGIAEPFQPVGFNTDGTVAPLGYTATDLMPSAMPVRTSGYFYNATTGALTPTTSCGGAAATVVFLPGWYKNANVLNQFTASNTASCKDVTFWFAPDPGPDGKLLTTDDRTGAYYMDFREGAGSTCSAMTAIPSRWCVGTVSDQNARVVVGTPRGWAPLGGAPLPGGTDSRPRIAVTVGTAQTIDEDLSQSWNNADRAATINGQAARYEADVCVIFCFSSDRAIRLRDFSPDVTSPPIDETGAPKGRIYVRVDYAVTNPNAANAAQLEVHAVGSQSGERDCGTYSLLSKSASDYGSGTIRSYTFTDAQAKTLADACGTVDLINGLELTLKVTGNSLNSPATQVYLDGMQISYNTFEGANFPNPVGGTTNPQAAKSDCDPAKPGAQLIFGGASHVYVADGSVEVCAGPYPTNPEDHMSVGVWAPPAVAEVGPSTAGDTDAVINYGGSQSCFIACWDDWESPQNTQQLLAIDKQSMNFRYGGTGAGDYYSWADIRMGGYTPPTGYRIDRVTVRVGYHPKNSNCTGLWGCPGANPQLSTSCGAVNWPKISSNQPTSQVANYGTNSATGAAVLYDYAANRNCIGVTANGASLPQGSVRWYARADGAFFSNYTDTLDGIQYQITLAPIDTSVPRLIPQTGCIVAHPNYNAGSGTPDCALIKAETQDFNDNWTLPWETKEGQLRGRFSVQGTVYAPSSAVEVDDTDVSYALATRGMVVRHLRVTGFGFRDGYQGVAVGNEVDKTPSAREVTFSACIQSPARIAARAACSTADGDRMLSRARVRYGVRPASGSTPATANVPRVQWWVNER